MANLYVNEKVTFNIPKPLKDRVVTLKEELNIPLSSIYVQAIREYVEKKELESWERGANLALKDSNYKVDINSIDDSGELYEY